LTDHLDARVAEFSDLVLASVQRTTATLVLHTVPLPADVRDGLVSWRARSAVAAAWHRMNAAILELAAAHPQVVVIDLAGLLADVPARARDDRLHRYADLPYTDAVLAVLAQQVRRVVQARLGLSRRVLALDLDNTLWGGVVGELGAGGVQLGGLYPGNCYAELQRTAARLREQGVVLALASKNDPDLVERTLTEHPEMVLRPDAFSAQAVNWAPKTQNLRRMAETLSLSTGSFVFLDDSAFECGSVRAELPEVAVVSAAGDPAHLTGSLLRHGWFDVLDLTDTDRDRPDLYRARSMRIEHSTTFSTTEDYLHALELDVAGTPVTAYTVPRVAQLAARTNQFNLTGIRFDEATTAAMGGEPGHLVAGFGVVDRFGDEGVVGAVWADLTPRVWRIGNVVLSCRVLGRGIEFAIVEWIARRAAAAGAERLVARFVRTDRNGAADGFLEKAGFIPSGEDGWCALDLAGRPDTCPTWIRLRDDER
jgi:FkbH-like protein